MFGLNDTLRSASPYGDPFTRPDPVDDGAPWRGPVPHYALDVGLWVRRDRRRRGLGLAILRAVPAMCRRFGIPHHSTLFTGAGSQALARKVGFKVSRARAFEHHS